MTTVTICRCSFCSGEIEFEASHLGEMVACPHCAMGTQLYVPGCPKNAPTAAPSPVERNPSSEQLFYQNGQVLVTNLRFTVGAKTFAMSGITSVEAECASAKFIGALVLTTIGAFMAFASDPVVKTMGWPLFIFSLFVLIQRFRPKYQVNVTTASGEATALESRSRREITEIVEALNNAILARG